MKVLTKILIFIKNLLFTPRCVFCDCVLEINTVTPICGICIPDSLFCNRKPCCVKCGKPLVGFGEKQLCDFCMEKHCKYVNRIISVFVYDGVVRESILRYKLMHIGSYAKTYAECMATRFFEEYGDISFDFICGAPSHKDMEKSVGFDHTAELCRGVSKITGILYVPKLLVKNGGGKRQSELSYSERYKNLVGRISVCENVEIANKTVLLIDDICTTRSTLMECAHTLKNGGAKAVYALTLSTTVKAQ